MVDISTVRINGQPLELTKTYKILTSDFVADGGDNFTVLASSRLSFTDMVATDMEALQAYFNKFPSSAPLRVPPPRVTCIHKSDGRACDIPVN
jgi:2',3'-cyclic-nucleotide 2'-phosphodiesterase (5'-nucleotidase family)